MSAEQIPELQPGDPGYIPPEYAHRYEHRSYQDEPSDEIDWDAIQAGIAEEQAEFDELIQKIEEAGGADQYFTEKYGDPCHLWPGWEERMGYGDTP